jgi:hypothetical protein
LTLPSGTISQIVDKNVSPQIDHIFEGASGAVDADFAAIMTETPLISFTTTGIGTALGLVGWDGLAISTATDLYFQRIAQGGIRDNTNAIKVTLTKGMIVPRRLRAGHKQTAKLTYDLFAISTDGTTAPLAVAVGQTLPTIPQVSELYVSGTVGLNLLSLNAVTDLDIDFGINVQTLGADGYAFPTFCGITTRRPRIDVGGLDLTALSTLGLNGLTLTAWKVYLRKISKGGTRVADATTQHIKFSGTAGMFRPDTARGTNESEASGTWCIHPTYDGTNAVIVTSTASAIT